MNDPAQLLLAVKAAVSTRDGPLHLTCRAKGRAMDRRWSTFARLADDLTAICDLATAPITTIELTIAKTARPLHPAQLGRALSNDTRGLLGFELRAGTRIARISPLETVTRNLGPKAAFDRLAAELDHPALATRWTFAADQILIDLVRQRRHRLHRGAVVVPQTAITRASTSEMATAMTRWLAAQVGPDGATHYKYWPSSGTYSGANNTVRQFMASACLALATRRDTSVTDACARNFRYNFSTFYTEEDDIGLINEGEKVKLGAAAVAVVAILNLPDASSYQRQLSRLTRFLQKMQNPDGSFRTFLRPQNRNDNQNFYPGEALLALAMLDDPALTPAILRGFHHYRTQYRKDRNPAFIPWHSMACCRLYRTTQAPELAEFVFEMNDWLVTLQALAPAQPDTIGEFFTPQTADFGPPHASSTGVYLEGLIEAHSLAREFGHKSRADTYRHAILRGLRSLRQLQFTDLTDHYYLNKTARVLGGLRSSTHDNTLRLDNVQHGLMAIWQSLDRFGDKDFEV